MPRDLIGARAMEVERLRPSVSPYANGPAIDITAGESAGLSQVAMLLWHRKFTIVAMALLSLLLSGLVSWKMPRIYRARSSVQLEGFSNDQVVPISSGVPNASAENYLRNQVKVLESETLAKRVAETLGIVTSTRQQRNGLKDWLHLWLNQLGVSTPGTPEEARIEAVRKALTIRTSLQSQVIELFYDAPDPQQAAHGAEVAVSTFINMNREARRQLVDDTTEWLNQQAAELKASIEKSNQHLQSFARASGLVIAGNDDTLAQERVRQTQESLMRAEAERAAKQSRFETASANGQDLSAEMLSNSPLRQYQLDLNNMRRDLAQLETIYTPSNYKVERLRAQITETERAIAEERKATVSRIGNEFAAASRLENLLSASHAAQLKAVEEEMANDRQYNVLKGEIDTTQKLYESVLQKAKEAGAASALRSTNIRVIDPATAPSVPYSPRVSLNMAIGLALGIFGGVGLVLVTECSDKIRHPGDLAVLNVPELGVIPSAQHARLLLNGKREGMMFRPSHSEVGLIAQNQGSSILAESFRGALTSILFGTDTAGDYRLRAARVDGRILVVTSLDMMEGKTTILTNLGVVAAERGQRVLLIDADLRRPRLHQVFELPNEYGLTDALSRPPDGMKLTELVHPTSTAGLWVLTSGPVDAVSSTQMHSRDLHVLLDRCRKDYDLVLIDTPPLMLYADGRIAGRFSDGVIMVVRANTRSQDELLSCYLSLKQDRIPVLGTILNDWKMNVKQSRAYGRYRDHYSMHA